MHLAHIDFLDEHVAQLNAEIAEQLKPFEDELNCLGAIPGVAYYVFLLPAWTAILGVLLSRPLSIRWIGLWTALVLGCTFTGFDQPFFLTERLFGFGIVVPQHWLAWHLPTLGLLLTLATLAVLLVDQRPPVEEAAASAGTNTWASGVMPDRHR